MTVVVQKLVHTATTAAFLPQQQQHREKGGECRRIILASSASKMTQAHILASKELNGPLCQYRKGFLDHLKPKPFVTSTLRIITQQGTLIMANFMQEQLELDMKRNALVSEGTISQAEADEQADEWEKEEWGKRWKVFPSRLLTAFAKYHAITLVIRAYEAIAAQLYDKVILDKLTMDPFLAARKLTSNSTDADNTRVAKQMFHTTFWANLIGFLADYSVHQVILCYGYYRYIHTKRRTNSNNNNTDNNATPPPTTKEGEDGAILTSFLRKSAQLMVSRSFGLVCSSAGGAIGTIASPGWGTLIFSNMAEGAAGVILDDGQGTTKKKK